jgi:endonuclease/exonuclease/phosphatase family metal-dependent hydrolase
MAYADSPIHPRSVRVHAWLGVLSLGLGCASEARGIDEPTQSGLELSVVSYNVNYGLAGDPHTLTAILDVDADVVLLQETTAEWEQVLRASPQLHEDWPHVEFHHCCGAGGLAVLSRWPIDTFEVLEPPPNPDAWFPAARAIIETPAGPVELLDVHLRPPVKTENQGWLGALSSTPEVRLAEVEHHLPKLDPKLPTIVAGDFNEGDGGRAVSRLAQAGFTDVLAVLGVRGPTWRWGGLRARLDHVLVDEQFEPLEGEVVEVGRSDHWPVRVRVRMRARE